MAVKLEFDSAKIVKSPTIVLSRRSGKKLGTIPATAIRFTDNFNSPNSIDFKVSKEDNGTVVRLWDEIKNFKLIWCKEWDAWFEITVDIDESNELVKNVSGKSLGESELSAIKIYNIEINTEDDIATEDYVPTVLYDGFNARASLLNRIMEKAPHYKIMHVDSSIANIQRSFSFDAISIQEAFNEISEEIGCLFVISQHSNDDGYPERGIYVYDLQRYCQDCGYRGDFNGECPECGSTNVIDGYGEDTNVFISSENIANEVSLSTDTESVNTCFRMETGDDLMTATVMSCNPNGTEYLWYIPDDVRSDMSDELQERLAEYDESYSYYQDEYQVTLSRYLMNRYNTLVNKYREFDENLETVSNTQGFKSLIGIIYNTIDFELYLTSSLMPTVKMSETNALAQANLLNATSLSPLAVTNIAAVSSTTVDLNALSLAKSIVRSTYQVTIKSSSFNTNTKLWTGVFTVTNYSDETDTADTASINIVVTGDYAQYVKQKIDKLLNKENSDEYDIASLFKKTCTESYGSYVGEFPNELKKYALNPLKRFHESCQSCLDILVEEGISDSETWLNATPNLYEQFYNSYYTKLQALEAEITLREQEINIITSLASNAEDIRAEVQTALNFKDYIGEDLWKEFCSYRRETVYSNSNYISDGLSNSELLERAREYIELAQKELLKSATLQHSISTSLNNLLVIPGFEPILDSFEVGNWIRVRIDGETYRLRLISYSIDFESLDELSVDFSDVTKWGDDVSDLVSVLNQASSMATSYQSVERQASKGQETTNTVNSWFEDGLNATLTRIINSAVGQTMSWDSHGMLMRQYDEPSQTYSKEQLKIINSTLAITDDNWKSTKTAIGKFYYLNPQTGEVETAYGVNGETIVGKLMIGEALGLYNSAGSLTFDANGFNVTNGTNTFNVNPNLTSIVRILKGVETLFGLDGNGNLFVTGTINANGGYFGSENPFLITDNGLDGTSSSNVSTSDISQSSISDLYSSGTYSNNFSIIVTKSGETDSINNISLILTSVELSIPYSYTITDTITETTIIDGDGSITDDEEGMSDEGDDDATIDAGSSQSTTTTTTTTTTYSDVMSVSIISSDMDVSSSVGVSLSNGTKTYRYTYSFGQSDMVTYLKTLVKNNNPNISSDYPLSDIILGGASAIINYKYHFTSYNSYAHIGTDYFNYNDLLTIRNGRVTIGITTINDLTVTKNIVVGANTYIRGSMASNDYWRLLGGGSSDSGYLEIATADNGTEPIYIRQYTGQFATLTRTLTLLDGSGNTVLPGTLKCKDFLSTATYIDMSSQVVFKGVDTWLGHSNATGERRLRISSAGSSGTYKHDTYIYGGNASSTTAIGIYDSVKKHSVLVYTDTTNTLTVGTQHFYFNDWGGGTRKPIASVTGDKGRIAYIGTNSTKMSINGQWGSTSYSSRNLAVASSDIRIKKNIGLSEVKSALDVINHVVMHSFDWIDGSGHQKIGFVADELEQLDNRLSLGGGYNKDGTMNVKSVNDFYLLGYVVKAIQELYAMIEEKK